MTKIKQREINPINVDDYIRQHKRLGERVIVWTEKKAVRALRTFARCIYTDLGWRLPRTFPHKTLFMGVKHYVKSNGE